MLRVVLAGLTMLVLVACAVNLAVTYLPPHAPGWMMVPAVVLAMAGAGYLAMFFNRPGFRPNILRRSHQERLVSLERRGYLERTAFQATRAFEVSSGSGEQLHFYLELEDGRVLFLSGQYLFDYSEIAEETEPEHNQPRTFPTTQFVTLRHRQNGVLMDLLPAGTLLPIDAVAPPFGRNRKLPRDGDVIADRSYDAVLQERMAA